MSRTTVTWISVLSGKLFWNDHFPSTSFTDTDVPCSLNASKPSTPGLVVARRKNAWKEEKNEPTVHWSGDIGLDTRRITKMKGHLYSLYLADLPLPYVS
jgi:hypothetical protein